MERKLILAGVGGQGVVYATKVLSQAAVLRGDSVLASENHGMSQRGGSVMSHLKIGGSQSPLIRRGTADAILAFDPVEAVRNLPFLRAGGSVFVNSANGLDPAVMPRLAELGVQVYSLDADACARSLGRPAVANVVVLGFAAAHGELGLTVDDLKAAVRSLGPARAVETNFQALEMGAATSSRRPAEEQRNEAL